jgi:hypothetical protein
MHDIHGFDSEENIPDKFWLWKLTESLGFEEVEGGDQEVLKL